MHSLWRWFVIVVLACGAVAPAPSAGAEGAGKSKGAYWEAKGIVCPDCDGTGNLTCLYCRGIDLTLQVCVRCQGLDQTKLTCLACQGIDQTTLPCDRCHGVDQTKLACWRCRGIDQTTLACPACSGLGRKDGRSCSACAGTGRKSPCYVCQGTGRRNRCESCQGTGRRGACYSCRGTGKRAPCSACGGTGKHIPCLSCGGRSVHGGPCEVCLGGGIVEVVVARHARPEDLLNSVQQPKSGSTTEKPSAPTVRLHWDSNKRLVAENGSFYDEIALVVYVNGYARKDGTYIPSHFRSLPRPTDSVQGPPLRCSAAFAAQGADYGLSSTGAALAPLQPIGGAFTKSGTIMRGAGHSRTDYGLGRPVGKGAGRP